MIILKKLWRRLFPHAPCHHVITDLVITDKGVDYPCGICERVVMRWDKKSGQMVEP